MKTEHEHMTVLQALGGSEQQYTLRIVTSIAVGAVLAGVATFGGWLFGSALDTPYSFDQWMIASLFVGSLVWMALLWMIWRPVRRAGTIIWPVLGTLTVAMITLLGVALADQTVRSDDEAVMSAVALAGCGIALSIWLPVILRLMHGKPVIGSDNQVAVHCPSCGYSLIGLNELRCPECGERFTIDQLIRSQGYGGADADKNTIRIAENDAGEDAQRRSMPD